MKLKVPGCSGGIGVGLHTTAMLLDDEALIDAGTGVGDLTIDAMTRVDAGFLAHAHLDHLCSIPGGTGIRVLKSRGARVTPPPDRQ